jgi:lipoyl(octanoyl) transferase
MALDEALLDAAATARAPLTLRFYNWTNPCLTIGCGQTIADVDRHACRSAGLPIVRRASGGTAVLHEAALGFSLAIPASSSLAVPDIVESYRLLGEPVHAALVGLGIDGSLVAPEEAHRGGRPTGLGAAACFGSLAPYEVVYRGRKIVGTSQVRRRGAILHHVMLPLRFDAARFAGFLAVGTEVERGELAAWLDSRIGSLTTAAGRAVNPTDVVAALIAAFARAFGAAIESDLATDAERQDAARLVASKYGNIAWTERR